MEEENVQKELDTIKRMVLSWKESYVVTIREGGGGEFLAQEFLNEIEDYVSPYLRRLFECNYIDGKKAKEFMDFCHQQVQELRDALREEGRDA